MVQTHEEYLKKHREQAAARRRRVGIPTRAEYNVGIRGRSLLCKWEEYLKQWRKRPMTSRPMSLQEYEKRGAGPRSGKIDLAGMDLHGVYLEERNLHGYNLRGTCLVGAHLKGTNLTGANLQGADLFGADLRGTNLFGADLRGADLRRAITRGTYLSGAKLDGAIR